MHLSLTRSSFVPLPLTFHFFSPECVHFLSPRPNLLCLTFVHFMLYSMISVVVVTGAILRRASRTRLILFGLLPLSNSQLLVCLGLALYYILPPCKPAYLPLTFCIYLSLTAFPHSAYSRHRTHISYIANVPESSCLFMIHSQLLSHWVMD